MTTTTKTPKLLSWSKVAGDEISATYRGETFSVIWASGKCKAYQAHLRGSIPISGWTTHDQAVATCERAAATLPKPFMELVDEYAHAAYRLGANSEHHDETSDDPNLDSNIRDEIVRRVTELETR